MSYQVSKEELDYHYASLVYHYDHRPHKDVFRKLAENMTDEEFEAWATTHEWTN